MKITDKYTFFWKDKIAQWNMTPFYEDNIEYICAEQYMMAKKALLFNDKEIYIKIINSKSPSDIQKYGREVKNFNNKIWNENKINIVTQGNLLKFSQNKELRNILFSTGNTLLVEASPYDCIWGVGLGQDDPLILNTINWRGENLLGKVLTKVRNILRSVYE